MTTNVDYPRGRAVVNPRSTRGRKAAPCRELRTRRFDPRSFGPISTAAPRAEARWPRANVATLSARVDALVELTSKAMEELARAYSPTGARAQLVKGAGVGTEAGARAGAGAGTEAGVGTEAGARAGASAALAHLQSLPDGSLGAVFGAPLAGGAGSKEFGPFVAEAFRVLRPGGMLVAEAQNALPIWVGVDGSEDPGQVRPEEAVLMCRQAGFPEATAVFHGGQDGRRSDVPLCTDYAVVAVR